ncbi:hypothetical protein [Halosimplex pelagicum]|uniref:Uncharacterized protein n=1 Tax=Halosimplex pelagicum TaxID=869886 RepID=A0A7D5PCL0_9EURY|nr:hypothetical protein [Halosimplex pelagicum]QLH83425.1 hypothetical protein HZS54_18095 [Halosimplex pelagicum]
MEISNTLALNYVGAGIFMFVAYAAFANIIDAMRNKEAKYLLSGVALTTGLVLSIGLSPLGTIASEAVAISPMLSVEASHFVEALVDVGTGFNLLFGGLYMYEKAKSPGVIAFYLNFISGFMFPIIPILGAAILAFSEFLLYLSPTSKF